jgi:hypothetical protein
VKLRDLVKIQYIPTSSVLSCTNKLSKINLNPNILEEGEETLIELELHQKKLVEAKRL